MKKIIPFLIIFAAPFLLNACVSASVARYPNANYLPTQTENVAVYNNFPPAQYEIIGEIEGTGAPAADWGSVSKRMRSEAAKIGGDAVVVLVQDTPFVGAINRPGRISGTTNAFSSGSGNFDAAAYGNNVYGTYNGNSWGHSTSNYAYTPPMSTPMYSKYARGVVIKYSQNLNNPTGQKAEEQIRSIQEETKAFLKANSQTEPKIISNEEVVKKLASACQSLEKANKLALSSVNAYTIGVIREKREQYPPEGFEREALIEDVIKDVISYKSSDKTLEDFRNFLVDNLPDFLSAIKTQNLYWSKRINSGIVLDQSIQSAAQAREGLIGEKIDAYQTGTFASLLETQYPDFLKLFPERMACRQDYKKLSELNEDVMLGIGATPVDGKLIINLIEVDSPAEKAGLMTGDVIVKVNGIDAVRRIDLMQQIALQKTGNKITLEVKRNLETKSFQIETESRKEYGKELDKKFDEALSKIYKR